MRTALQFIWHTLKNSNLPNEHEDDTEQMYDNLPEGTIISMRFSKNAKESLS